MFPLVDGRVGADTLVQLVNVSDAPAYAWCVYQGGVVPLQMHLTLAPEQPTHWLATQGRGVDGADPECGPGLLSCDGAGLDPGEIPATPGELLGALWCAQTDAEGALVGGNALVGSATVRNTETGDDWRYSAVGFLGLSTNDGDSNLCLGGSIREGCPAGAEYQACPDTWFMTQVTEGSGDPITHDGSVGVELTSVACSQDLSGGSSNAVTIFSITNELEQNFSSAANLPVWSSSSLAVLSNAFRRDLIGTDLAFTRIRGSGSSARGAVFLAAVRRDNGDGVSLTTVPLVRSGARTAGDVLRFPIFARGRR